MRASFFHRLENNFLAARFSPENGNLVHLSAVGGKENLVESSFCRYFENDKWTSESPSQPDAIRFKVICVNASHRSIESIVRSKSIEVRRQFELKPGSPFLKMTCETRGLCPEWELRQAALPRIQFAPNFADAFEDDRDLYFDGEELGGGYELPCWRVFFRTGRPDGLIVATRSKLAMSRLNIFDRGFEIRPDVMNNYDTMIPIVNPAMTFKEHPTHTATFEIGPWSKADHDAILQSARLNEPVHLNSPKLIGTPRKNLRGTIFDAVDFAAQDATSPGFSHDKWMVLKAPFSRKGCALFAGPSVRPPALVLDPRLSGCYRIFVGIGNGDGVAIRLSGDAEPTFRRSKNESTPFQLRLSGSQKADEIFFRIAEMDGKKIEIYRFPNSFATTVVDYVRFEPLTDSELKKWRMIQKRKPVIPLSGFNDIPDMAIFTDARDPDPAAYRINLYEHANCGIRKVYWRIDGQCSDYPSKVNTMRYISAKVHGVFYPQAKAYGRVLKKTDMLALAVAAARKYNLQLYGWMRFNAYMGNVQSDFFKNNPQYWEEGENGYKARKLCLAYPEVRKHKVDILVEAAGYGLQGLSLGFLRQPPILHYAPILVEGYRQKYGRLPPRNSTAPDQTHMKSFPETDEEYIRWFQYRADFLTRFGRELRTALNAKDLGRVKISIWVRPNHCLFDGIDMQSWLNEGLCDEVVADDYVDRDYCRVSPEWKRMVQEKAPLIRGGSFFDAEHARRVLPEIIAEGYDGVCVYESDYAVHDTAFIELFDSLRQIIVRERTSYI